MNHTIELLSETNIDAAANSLTNAFMNDPLQCYVFPDEQERTERSPAHFRSLIRYGMMFGKVYSTADNKAVAVWLPPGQTDVTAEKAEVSGLNELPALLGEDAYNRFFSALAYLEPYHQQDAAEPHWYTMVIGVDDELQGRGAGKALMKKIMDEAGKTGHSIYLETAGPSNIPFYTGLGFKLLREMEEPVSGLRIWTFKFTP